MKFKFSVYSLSALLTLGFITLILNMGKLMLDTEPKKKQIAGGSATGNALALTEIPLDSLKSIPFANLVEPQIQSKVIKKPKSIAKSISEDIHSISIYKNCDTASKSLWCLSLKNNQSPLAIAGRRIMIKEGVYSLDEILELDQKDPFEISFANEDSLKISGDLKVTPLLKDENSWILDEKTPLIANQKEFYLKNCKLLPAHSNEGITASKILFEENGSLTLIEEQKEEKLQRLLFHCP